MKEANNKSNNELKFERVGVTNRMIEGNAGRE